MYPKWGTLVLLQKKGTLMQKSAMIRARIEPVLKNKAEKLLERLGLNATEAITLFYRQVLLQDGLPFEVIVPATETSSRLAQANQADLVAKARAMSPEERLEAFYEHSRLLSQFKNEAAQGESRHAR